MAFDEEDLTKKGINGVYDQLDFDGAVRSSALWLNSGDQRSSCAVIHV